MKLPVYAIRDVRSTFTGLTVDTNDATAARNFAHAVMQVGSIMNSHPQDFSLYRLGEFDTDTGVLIPLSPIQLVMDGVSVEGVTRDGR